MGIELHYTDGEGTDHTCKYESNVTKIDLSSQGMVSINLSPLRYFTNLQILNLVVNQLQSIDLSPLSSCTSLQELHLSWNLLESVDLSPLASCSNLQILNLNNNPLERIIASCFGSCEEIDLSRLDLKKIDLSYLDSCTNLKTLDLSLNKLQSIDLVPLSSCINLQRLSLWGNQLQSIDMTPLKSCTNLQALNLNNNPLESMIVSCFGTGKEIDLARFGLKKIDLSHLDSCTNLETLDLSSNKLQSIDLSPLATCISLQTLELQNNQLQSIDMTPLKSCTNLQALNLNNNPLESMIASCFGTGEEIDLSGLNLKSVDLSNLAHCSNLQELDLSENQLQSIDLTPLATCTSLQKLKLNVNLLQSIDLTPLKSCTNLENLELWSNQFQSIDLSPLATCTSLQLFELHNNQIKSIDVTPLNSEKIGIDTGGSARHSWLRRWLAVYKRPTHSYPWSFLHQVIEQYGTDRRVQQDILCAMGFENYGFIDQDLCDIFSSLRQDMSDRNACEHVANALIEKITGAVDRGRETTGLKLEKLLTQHTEIAKRTQRIIKLREAEIQHVRVGVKNNEVDLRELWLTAYGYEVLSALGERLTTNAQGLGRIKLTFAELGFDLKTSETSSSKVKMRKNLKKSIWWIVENRGKSWIEIDKQSAGPEVTAAVIASLPDCLKETLLNSVLQGSNGKKSIMISTNNLANRFIRSKWEIYPAQSKQYRNLFTTVRKYCRDLFRHYIKRGRIEWIDSSGRHLFGVVHLDEVRGNIILSFVEETPHSEWS